MDKLRRIRESIQKIASAANKNEILFTVKVLSINGDTCTVDHNGMELSDVRLSAVIDASTKKKLIKPTIGSHVLVADLSNGGLRDLAIIQVSETDSIIWNGGDLGGLIKIEVLTSKINDLVNTVNSLITTFNSHVHVVSTTGSATAQSGTAAATLTQANTASTLNKSDFEDTKIKH